MAIDVITYKAPSVFPGDLTRPTAPFITEVGVQLTATPVTLFGVPVAIDAGTGHYRPIAGGDVTATVQGFSVRTFPTQSSAYPNSAINAGGPSATDTLTILKEGYIGVSVYGSGAAPTKGSAVYVGTIANAGVTAVGRISSAADGGNSFALTGAHFTGGVDANGNSEIYVRIPA